MCRMLLRNAKNPTPLKPVVINSIKEIARKGLSAQCGIGPHGDGFGIFWMNSHGYGIYKSTDPIWKHEIPNLPAYTHIIHARKISRGEKSYVDTHPFQLKDFVLAHNGTIYSFKRNPILYKPIGSTDSEHFLCLLAEAYYTGSSIEKALKEAIESVDLASSLNAIIVLINEKRIFVINLYYREIPNCPNYYTLWLHKGNDEFYISSEPIKSLGEWIPLSEQPGELSLVEAITGKPESLRISKS